MKLTHQRRLVNDLKFESFIVLYKKNVLKIKKSAIQKQSIKFPENSKFIAL